MPMLALSFFRKSLSLSLHQIGSDQSGLSSAADRMLNSSIRDCYLRPAGPLETINHVATVNKPLSYYVLRIPGVIRQTDLRWRTSCYSARAPRCTVSFPKTRIYGFDASNLCGSGKPSEAKPAEYVDGRDGPHS